MATEITVDETTLNVTVTVSNERGPIGPAGVVEAVEVGDITPVSSGKLLGRHGGGSGAAQEVGLDGGLEFQGANIRREALTGDVTASAGSNATTIASDAVTNAKLANMAEATIKGRASGAGTGDPQDLTAAQVQAIVMTPAAIDTALQSATAAQEASIRDSLEVLPRDLHLRGLRNAINIASTSGDMPTTVFGIGDSFSDFAVYDRTARVVGSYKCGQASGGGDSGVSTITDFTKSPDGSYYQIASGGNLTAAHLTSGAQGPASHIYYTLYPGTGSAQFWYSLNGAAWVSHGSAINTATITDVQIGSIALPTAWQNVRVRVTATGGTVNGFIGQGLSGPGVTLARFVAPSGTGVHQVGSITEAIWKAMIAGYKASGGAQIVMVTFADGRFSEGAAGTWVKGDELWAEDGPIDVLHQWSKVANSTVDWMVVGPHQCDPARTEGADATLDPLYAAIGIGSATNDRIKDGARAQRDWAILRSEGFVDCIPLFPDFAAATADGVYDDDIHLNAKGEAYKRAWVWRSSNLGFILGDAGYNSQFRLGGGYLTMLAGRAVGALPQVSGVSAATNPALLPGVFAELRSGDPVSPEQAGIALRCSSTNVARLSTYNTASHTDLLEFTLSGASPLIQPLTAQTIGSATLQALLGTTSKRYADVVTAGLNVGWRATTTDTAFVVADHTIEVTSGSPNITVLAVASSNLGKIHVLANTGAGTPTIIGTVSGSVNPVVAAQTTWIMQSTGSAWKLLAKITNAP